MRIARSGPSSKAGAYMPFRSSGPPFSPTGVGLQRPLPDFDTSLLLVLQRRPAGGRRAAPCRPGGRSRAAADLRAPRYRARRGDAVEPARLRRRPRPLRRARQRGAPPDPGQGDQSADGRRAGRLLPRRLLHADRRAPRRSRAADQGRARARRPRRQGRRRAQGAVHHRAPAGDPRGQPARAGRARAAPVPARQDRQTRPASRRSSASGSSSSPTATTRRSTSSTSWCAASTSCRPRWRSPRAASSRAGARRSPPAPATPCSARSRSAAATPCRCRGSRAPACRSPSPMSAKRPTPMSPTSTRIPPTAPSATSARRCASAARRPTAIGWSASC